MRCHSSQYPAQLKEQSPNRAAALFFIYPSIQPGGLMFEAIILISLLTVLALLFWPRRDPYVRRVTKSYNGRPFGVDRE
jgi:hypothetical protein